MDSHLIKSGERHQEVPVIKSGERSQEMFEVSAHYYGDTVRRLFVTAAVVIVVTTPFVSSFLPVPVLIAALGALAIVIVAGLTNPRERWSAALNLVTATVGSIVFQYQAAIDYLVAAGNAPKLFMFTVDEVLAVIFMVAVYYSSKTFRVKFIA
ncbi:MAG: hypothetical protein WC817_00815 [Patescibacteria group bacterium]|jgi:hypothetical protein